MKMKKIINKSIHPKGSYWIWYTIPALLFYLMFMAYPLFDSLRLSLYSINEGSNVFVGFQNFRTLFTDIEQSTRYWNAMSNTTIFFTIHMVVQNMLGILFAVLLTQKGLRGSKIYQTIIFIPATLAILITGYLWKLILSPIWTGDLWASIGLPFMAQPWLGNEKTALISTALVSSWQWVGIPTMLFVTGLLNISDDLYEAADIEGATKWQVFRYIKLPLLKPIIGMISILTFVNNFNAFDVIFAMENVNGAPGFSTDLLGTLFYRVGIAGQHPIGIPNPGMGATITTITFGLLIIGSLIILRLTKTKEQ